MAAAISQSQTLRGADGCVHFSDLKQFARSPAHYKHAVTSPRVTTAAIRRGLIVDRLIFGGDCPIYPGDDRRGNSWDAFTELAAGRELLVYPGERRGKAYKEFVAAHPDARIFTQREHDDAAAHVATLETGRFYAPEDFVTWKELADAEPIARAVQADELAVQYLAGRHQVALEWEMMGVRCATRGVDCVGAGWISDLKCTQTTQPDRYMWHARRMLWNAQLAFYVEACRQNGIDTSKGVLLVGVEATAPHPVTVLRLTPRALEDGEKCIHLWLEQLRACEATGAWPGYVQSVVDFDVEQDVELVGLEDDEA